MILSSSWSIVSNVNIGGVTLSQTDLPGIIDVESKRCFDIVGLPTEDTRQAVISFDHWLTVSRRLKVAVDTRRTLLLSVSFGMFIVAYITYSIPGIHRSPWWFSIVLNVFRTSQTDTSDTEHLPM